MRQVTPSDGPLYRQPRRPAKDRSALESKTARAWLPRGRRSPPLALYSTRCRVPEMPVALSMIVNVFPSMEKV
jgi:hypothetical protein